MLNSTFKQKDRETEALAAVQRKAKSLWKANQEEKSFEKSIEENISTG